VVAIWQQKAARSLRSCHDAFAAFAARSTAINSASVGGVHGLRQKAIVGCRVVFMPLNVGHAVAVVKTIVAMQKPNAIRKYYWIFLRVLLKITAMKTKQPPDRIELDSLSIELVKADKHTERHIKIKHTDSGSSALIAPKQLENWALRQLRASIV